MTTEQLNVIVTAQTEDFQQKINGVNKSLERTLELAKSSAETIVNISAESTDSGFSKEFARQAETGVAAEEEKSIPFYGIEGFSGTAANVLSLRRGETLIGAVSENGSAPEAQGRPFEIHTTVELDGEKLGESVGYYNSSRSRITNGRN